MGGALFSCSVSMFPCIFTIKCILFPINLHPVKENTAVPPDIRTVSATVCPSYISRMLCDFQSPFWTEASRLFRIRQRKSEQMCSFFQVVYNVNVKIRYSFTVDCKRVRLRLWPTLWMRCVCESVWERVCVMDLCHISGLNRWGACSRIFLLASELSECVVSLLLGNPKYTATFSMCVFARVSVWGSTGFTPTPLKGCDNSLNTSWQF